MAKFLLDFRLGLRNLARYPGFSSVVVLTLALGVGVSSAVFSVVSGTLINPTPWRDADAIRVIRERDRTGTGALRLLSFARFEDLVAQSRSISSAGAATGFAFVMTDGPESETLPGALLTPEIFDVLGLGMAVGRPLSPADSDPAAPRAVVISHSTWQNRYGGDPDIVGRRLEIESADWTVVGVLDRESWFPQPGTAILAPLRLSPEQARDRTQRGNIVIARLAPGASGEALDAELEVISQRLADAHPDTDPERWPLIAQTVSEMTFGGPARTALYALAGGLVALLLIACANLTGLFLTRSAARSREIAVRAAVGGSRPQIVSQLLTENLALALIAVPAALLVARFTVSFIYTQVPGQVRGFELIARFDLPVWLFAIAVALGTIFVFGLAPALRATRVDLAGALKEGGDRGSSSAGSQRLRSALVVGQLALSVTLLVAASLFNESFYEIANADVGFDMKNLLYAPVGLPPQRYAEPVERADFVDRLMQRLETVPGIVHAGVADSAASAGGGPTRRFELGSNRGLSGDARPETRWAAASPGFLRALGLEIKAGRTLEETDDAQAQRVALVSELFVRSFLGDTERVLGESIVLDDEVRVEIVGVVQDVSQLRTDDVQQPQVWVPYAQQPSPFVQVVARTSVDPLSIGPAVRAQIDGLDPLLPVMRLTTALLERELSAWPLAMFGAVLGLLGLVGLAMATVGIYGLVRYATQQRTREFGIRTALGAEPSSIVLLVLRHTWWLAGTGLALGLMLAALVAPALRALLYNVDAFDPKSMLVPCVLLGLSTVLAAFVPATQASRADPMLALNSE